MGHQLSKVPRTQINIYTWYDFKEERWRGRVEMQEYRCGSQYGGAVVWEESAKQKGSRYESWIKHMCDIVRKKALTLITYEPCKTKKHI